MTYIIVISLFFIILALNSIYETNEKICDKLDRIIKLLEVGE